MHRIKHFPNRDTSTSKPSSTQISQSSSLQSALTDQQFLYYSRQLLLPDWSEQRQLQLQQKKVLIVGMGGLGCPAATYLAGAGVGWLMLADGDKVELSNLPRQTLFRQHDIGQNKAVAAADSLQQLNPLIRIDALPKMLDEAELARRIAWADLVLDCSDQLETKLCINRLCQQLQRSWLGASASGYQGYSWLINPARGGCLMCLGHQQGLLPGGCLQQGIYTPLVGQLGLQLANLALQQLMNEQLPASFVQIYQHRQQQFSLCQLQADPTCTCCGVHPHE
jgi:sulfur carrier protein ThiS adenylyltransferase